MKPDKTQAFQFALMVKSGLPPSEAILYFTPSENPHEIHELLQSWLKSSAYKHATLELLGKSWQEMTLEEQIQTGLDRHYAGLAYFLFTAHYAEVGAQDKTKLDAARGALEAKQAGTAGKTDALSRFFDDINSGKLKLLTTPAQKPN